MKVGIINGVYKEEGYDHLKTLKLAAGIIDPFYRVDVVQIYLNSQDLENTALLKLIAERVEEYRIELISHIHGIPRGEELKRALFGHSLILRGQKIKRAVIHFDESLTSQSVEAFNEVGIDVYVENIHKGITAEELAKHDDFVEFVLRVSQGYNIGAVLDFGRYFVGETENKTMDIIGKILETCKRLMEKNVPVFFHTVGSRNFDQKREDWVSPGCREDKLPQKKILEGIVALSAATAEPLIIESEKVAHAIEGVKFFKALMQELNG